MPSTSARVFDLETNQVATIPVGELAPGMVKVNVRGESGDFWVPLASVLLERFRDQEGFTCTVAGVAAMTGCDPKEVADCLKKLVEGGRVQRIQYEAGSAVYVVAE
jgi:hypothetical protein